MVVVGMKYVVTVLVAGRGDILVVAGKRNGVVVVDSGDDVVVIG